MEVFPNPAKSEAQVVLKGFTPDMYEFSLINLAGQPVIKHRIAAAVDNTTLNLDLQGLDAGLYFYSLRNQGGNQVFAGKLVVQSR